MWWPRAWPLFVAVTIGASAAIADEIPVPSPTELIRERSVALDRQAADIAAREDRLALWEGDLSNRARGERYFTDLEGYVTPGELMRSIMIASFVSVFMTLLLIRLMERYGLWRPGTVRHQLELKQLESRVMGGLREFDHLLTRVVDRISSDITTRRFAGKGREDDEQLEATSTDAPATEEARTVSSVRERVLELARAGRSLEEICRVEKLGPAEITFILRTGARR